MKGRILALVLLGALLTGCAAPVKQAEKYQATFMNLFDTVTTILGYADSQEAFEVQAQQIHDGLLHYHQLFDIYQDYEGLNNLKTVNDQAGIAPVKVDRAIIDLLLDCRAYYEATGGLVNVTMGSVLALWHDARAAWVDNPQAARLPEETALKEAAEHSGFDTVVIDEEASTVFLIDPDQRLDVGAIAKGWSVERVCREAPSGMLISVGGNVCATGPKPSGESWVVGIQKPEGEGYLHTLNIQSGAVVTSGDYQRYFVVDGKPYHHIIDPDTLYPGRLWRSVTVVCPDSGLADALSTALFLLPREEGQRILNGYDAEAVWLDAEGKLLYSPGFEALIRT